MRKLEPSSGREPLKKLDRVIYNTLGNLLESFLTDSYKLILKKAYPEIYPKLSFARNVFWGIIASIISILVLILAPMRISILAVPTYALKIALVVVVIAIVWIIVYFHPFFKISSRAKQIDRELPYAINFMAALASANVPISRIFGALARQRDILPEMAKEAALMYRDMVVFNYDIMTAILNAISRSASVKLQDFLQGIITITYTGGNLKNYLMTKAEQYMFELRQEQRKDLEALSVIIESFVVVGVAAPIFLVIIFTVMGWISANPAQAQITFTLIKMIMFLVLPVIHVVYAYLAYDAVRRK